MELDKNLSITNIQSAGVFGSADPNQVLALEPVTPSELVLINTHIAKLSPEDQQFARRQVVCAIDPSSRLGSMGPIFKVMAKNNTPMFVCCKGCEAEAKAHPDETLIKVQNLMNRLNPKK